MHPADNCAWWEERLLKLLEPRGVKNMIADLTDVQVARVLELSAKIARVSQELPPSPRGFSQEEVSVEIAKSLRASLEKQNEVLLELGALLR